MLNRLTSAQRLVFVIAIGIPALLFITATIQFFSGGGTFGYIIATGLSFLIWLMILAFWWVDKGEKR